MKHRVICAITCAALITASLTSCESKEGNQLTSYMANNKDIQLSISEKAFTGDRDELTWVELDQLKTYDSIRNKVDDSLNVIKFEQGSKNGVLFIDTNNNWCGNNSLMAAFANKEFVKNYWADNKLKSDIAKTAMDQFSDISSEDTGIIAAINAYYNIMPANSDGTSGLMNYMSRKDAMAAIYRADTPVRMIGDNEFDKIFGYDEYNYYASNLKDCSWFNVEDGSLNPYTYYSTITRAEAMYMIVQRYFKDEYDSLKDLNNKSFGDCKLAEDILTKYKVEKGHSWETYVLEDALEKPENGVPEDLYKAIVICNKHGIIGNTTNWNKGIRYGELLTMLIKAYSALYNDTNYPVNAKFGTNEGNKPVEQVEIPVVVKEEADVGKVKKGEIVPADPIDEVLEKYKDIINMTDKQIEVLKRDSEGFTFELVDTHMKVDYCNWLNVRSGPSTDYQILKEIEAGTEVHIIAKCVENGWYRVITDGVVAYQCGAYFSNIE